jgi:lipooligosaccharide transport system ATP-binding protein
MEAPQLAIRLRGVRKRFGEITAVDGLDLDVPEGTCVGLLGPNGAGKSTTMKMLTAQAMADAGEIEVLGFKVPEDSKQARALCGVTPQLDNLDVELIANLVERADTPVDKLSGGMRRRLLIARGLVHRPRLLLLDEPTVGLDPQVRQELWALIDALRTEGTTILMSTHYIEEAERLADTVESMANGRVVARGRPAELVRQHAGVETLEVYGPPARLAAVREEAQAAGYRVRQTGTAVAILGADAGNGGLPEGVTRAATLEDVFVLLTGEEVE